MSQSTDRPISSNQCPSCERALSLLQLYGVPPDRARTAANGIEVLMTRSRKEAVAVNSTIERLRAALLKICTSGTLFSQMPAIARDALDTTGLPDETTTDVAASAYEQIAEVLNTQDGWSVVEHVTWMRELLGKAERELHDVIGAKRGYYSVQVLCEKIGVCLLGEAPNGRWPEEDSAQETTAQPERQWRGIVAHDPKECGPCDVELRGIEMRAAQKASDVSNPADFRGGPLEYPEDFDSE